MLTPTLDFNIYLSDIVAKAHGSVARVTRFSGPKAFRILYTALMLPRLEYYACVWSFHQPHLMHRLEGAQHRPSRTLLPRTQCPLPRSHPYEERLRSLNWHSIDHRRIVEGVRLLCSLFGGSMRAIYLEHHFRIHEWSGQNDRLRAQTLRHIHSFLPRLRSNLPWQTSLHVRVRIPEDKDSALLCVAVLRARSIQCHWQIWRMESGTCAPGPPVAGDAGGLVLSRAA